MKAIRVVDSHTGGEATRVVLEGGPDLGSGSLAERAARLRRNHDHYRTAIVGEPRGAQAMIGALLCEPASAGCAAGVIFFDNAGYLGMCGHGTIGLAVTLAHLGRLQPGPHHLDTPVGVVGVELHDAHRVSLANVPSYRWAAGVRVDVPGHGPVVGDVAWGGNWFFVAEVRAGIELVPENAAALTAFSKQVRQALSAAGVTGAAGAEIDHVELSAQSSRPGVDSRNFVLCPGDVYDRSPCGTGTSARLACLAAEGTLQPGAVWRQESLIGSIFEASFERDAAGHVLPRITGSAHVTAEATLLLDEADPFRWGIGAEPDGDGAEPT
jgi:proline racemase